MKHLIADIGTRQELRDVMNKTIKPTRSRMSDTDTAPAAYPDNVLFTSPVLMSNNAM